MQKIRLALDNLTVESFATGRDMWQKGTVAGQSEVQTNTEALDCTFGVPCPYDVYATLDAASCAAPTAASCELNSALVFCRDTGIDCDRFGGVTHGTGAICCP